MTTNVKEVLERILQERVLTVQQACDRFPRQRIGRRPHPSTVIRYISRGLAGVKLGAVKFGQTWLRPRKRSNGSWRP